VKSGKNITGEHYSKTLSRLEFININMTVLDVKKLILSKVKSIFKEDSAVLKSDEELNKNILLQIYDNLPYFYESKYSKKKATCEFCRDRHNQAYTCDIKIDKLSGNSDEGYKTVTIKDILEKMEHKRDLIIGVIFRENCGAAMKHLDPEFDQSHIKDMNKKDK
jgi:hypothetical protein